LAYATALADESSIRIITTDRGLVAPSTCTTLADLEAFSCVDIASGDPRYIEPLTRDTEELAENISASNRVVLLGSIATGKYVDILLAAFGEQLVFPAEFVGRGDMSRGGLLLRHARSGSELRYTPVAGAVRHGKRPPKLPEILETKRPAPLDRAGRTDYSGSAAAANRRDAEEP
jgi:hypothetical protein